jgi:UDP-N-acetylmuramoylalanine--D-glutamate ligase
MIDVTPFIKTLNGKPVAVFGLGLSGLATINALKAAGASVIAWDDKIPAQQAAEKLGANIMPLDVTALENCACLILAPGVPYTHNPHAVVIAAQEAGVEIIGDLEILHRVNHGHKTIGITGTNGKSTTTALTAHILNSAGKTSSMGGNIGKPVLDLDIPKNDGAFVLEISSYQVDLCPTFRPDIAALMNITPDHIDRHGSVEGYAAAKEHMFEGEGLAVIGVDDEPSVTIYEHMLAFETGTRKVVPVSCNRELESGIYVLDGQLYDRMDGALPLPPISLNGITTLMGTHNHQNAAIAYAICKLCGLKADEILTHIKTYPGLPHRQFTARTINGVAYINDSKATNAVSAGKALASYSNIYWIAGGRPKEGGLNGLENLLSNVKHTFIIGEAMEEFSGWLTLHSAPHTNSGTLQAALAQAHDMAQAARGQPGGAGVVLLSPACASFDQFKSFEERGNVFMNLIMDLREEEAA